MLSLRSLHATQQKISSCMLISATQGIDDLASSIQITSAVIDGLRMIVHDVSACASTRRDDDHASFRTVAM